MNVKVILRELVRIFQFRNVAVAVSVFLVLSSLFLGVNGASISKFHTENYPDQISVESNHYSVELKFKDTLLKKYGETIDANELSLIKEELEKFKTQVYEAERNDEVLIRAGYNAEMGYFEGNTDISQEDNRHVLDVINGFYQYEGTDYPVYFLKGFQEIVDYMDTAGKYGKIQIYHVLSDTVVNGISQNLHLVIFAVIASLFIIVPFMVNENKNQTVIFEYSSKVGRKSYINKIAAVIISQFITVGIGAFTATLLLFLWDISRYYNCKIDTVIFTLNAYPVDLAYSELWNVSSKLYSGLTFLEFYILLLAGISLCGVMILLLTAIISYHFDNIFAPFAISVLLLSLIALFYERFVVIGLNLPSAFGANRFLTTKYEPFIFIAVLMALTIIVAVIEIRRKKRAEI